MPALDKHETPLPTTTVKWRFPSVHPEGRKFAVIAGAITVLAFLLDWDVLAWLLVGLTIWVAAFFRDPIRTTPRGDRLIVAPADGLITLIARVPPPPELRGPEGLADGEYTRVSIFMPLNQVATVSTPEARMLSVQVWDRSNVQPVEKAIRSAGLGLNPITDGQMIRLPIPELTEERRKELAKLVGQYAEKARIAVRNVRRDGMDHLKQDEKKHDISEDERKRLETEVQKLTDDTIKEIDEAAAAKEKEILGK